MSPLDGKYVVDHSGCWVWQRSTVNGGYGILQYKNVHWLAHRFSYVINVGEIPTGMQVLHSCDNPPCINPEHLTVGTVQDNMNDKVLRGRQHRPTRESCSLTKLSKTQVEEIVLRKLEGESPNVLAKEYGISRGHVFRLLRERK